MHLTFGLYVPDAGLIPPAAVADIRLRSVERLLDSINEITEIVPRDHGFPITAEEVARWTDREFLDAIRARAVPFNEALSMLVRLARTYTELGVPIEPPALEVHQ